MIIDGFDAEIVLMERHPIFQKLHAIEFENIYISYIFDQPVKS